MLLCWVPQSVWWKSFGAVPAKRTSSNGHWQYQLWLDGAGKGLVLNMEEEKKCHLTSPFCQRQLKLNSTNNVCLHFQSTEYKGEYWNDHPTIRLFWKVFHELPLEKKKQFLCTCYSILYMTCFKTSEKLFLHDFTCLCSAGKVKQCLCPLQCSSQEVTAYPSWAWKAWNWWSSPPVEESITYPSPTPASTCWTCPSTRV